MGIDINEAYASIQDKVVAWAKNLVAIIDGIRDRENKPVLIALSRKMPRFLDWIIATHANDTVDSNIVDKISMVELTTELTIPFFFQSRDGSSYEYIILDDIIIYGSTLRNVSEDLKLLYHRESHISCMLRRRNLERINNVNQQELDVIPEADKEDVETFIDAISIIVEDSQLPIDMEFPVFFIENKKDGCSCPLINSIETEATRRGLTVYSIADNKGRFSIDLTERNTVGANNDFTKLRFFCKNDDESVEKVVLEVIAPMVLSQSDLMSLDKPLFEDETYQEIWNLTTFGIRFYLQTNSLEKDLLKWEKLKTNFVRSLCVWASYLFSLSTFIKNESRILPEAIRNNVKLNQDDLSLIIGEMDADFIYPELESLIKRGVVSTSLNGKVVNIPKSFSPVPFQNELRSKKILTAILAEEVTEIFEEIFKYQHYSNPKFSNKYILHERPFFGETYDSLTESFETYFSDSDNVTTLHCWIDENIDSGYVVPKYESVKDDKGTIHWRRYFHPGIRKYK